MAILEDKSQSGIIPRHVVIEREYHSISPQAPKCTNPSLWNKLHMPEKVAVHEPPLELRATGGRRQHQPHRNSKRLYSPQDQSQIHPRFVIFDRVTGQVLARVRGTINHVKSEASALAASQGCKLSDLIIRIEGAIE